MVSKYFVKVASRWPVRVDVRMRVVNRPLADLFEQLLSNLRGRCLAHFGEYFLHLDDRFQARYHPSTSAAHSTFFSANVILNHYPENYRFKPPVIKSQPPILQRL
jgi:hypothetical protein